uniref:Putative ovule protein n=1 Tax=Solanum chacoense TaxID=4108 RepID=A0A0V0GFR4_SOLCH
MQSIFNKKQDSIMLKRLAINLNSKENRTSASCHQARCSPVQKLILTTLAVDLILSASSNHIALHIVTCAFLNTLHWKTVSSIRNVM